MSRTPQDLAARFWSKVDQSGGPTACWPWTRSRRPEPENYGNFKWINPVTGAQESVNAARVAFYLTHGYLPAVACHDCDNPPCCNPFEGHVYDGTHATNGADKANRGRARGRTNQSGEENTSSVLTDEIVLDARRRCRAGETHQAIADLHGVDRPTLSYAITGKTWGHLDATEAPVAPRRGGTRLTDDDVRAIRASAGSAQELARAHEITPAAVYAIRSRRSWKHVE